MKILMKSLSLFIALTLFGCSKSSDENLSLSPQGGKQEVRLFAESGGVKSRTSIEDDLQTTRWKVGDKLALWAKSDDSLSGYQLEGEIFTMRYFGTEYTSAEFSAAIDPMEEGVYTYYGVYPEPKSFGDSVAVMNLGSTQSGAYDGVNDIMVATPLVSRELSASTLGAPQLSFNHLMHAFRIEIPEGRNLMGGKITKLDITFPQDVVGDVAVNICDMESAPIIVANGGAKVSVEPVDGFDGVDGEYLWIFLNPTYLSGDVEFRAYGEGGVCAAPITTTIDKELISGAITPLKLTIPEPKPTTLRVKLLSADVKSRIGEDLMNVKFTAPDGTYIDGATASKTYSKSEDDYYDINFYNASDFEEVLKGGKLNVWFETKSVEKSPAALTLSDVVIDSITNYTVDVPYFYTTNFSEISKDGSGTDVNDEGTAIDGLTDWYGALRSTWTKGTCVYIRSYSNAGGPFASRVTSAKMGTWGLKSGVTGAKVSVKFDVYWKKNASKTMGIIVGGSTDITLGATMTTTTTTSLTSGKSATLTKAVSSVTPTTRIAWKTKGVNGSLFGGTYFKYDDVKIDNVTVTISE